MEVWKKRIKQLKAETLAIYLAAKDARVPWYGRVLAVCVVAYIFSPIDLIPDFIPILGYLDDLILVPLGIILVLKIIPPKVLAEYREKANAPMNQPKPISWVGAGAIVTIWFGLGIVGVMAISQTWLKLQKFR